MFNGIDLMKYLGSKMNKYVTKLMEIVYTRDEMRDGLIIERESTSKRNPLDLERFDLIKSKLFSL